MKKTKLSKLKDGDKFIISKKLKTEYFVTNRIKGGILVTATISSKTYTKSAKQIVYVFE